MKKADFNYALSILLLISVLLTGLLGYIQAQFDLRQFVPHRYFAYTTLILVLIHVSLNARKVWKYWRNKFRKRKAE